MPIDRNKQPNELLKNASAGELKTLAQSITPFLLGKNPPQVMEVNNQNVIKILEKYGLIETRKDPSTGNSIPINVHPSLGEVKVQTDTIVINSQTGTTQTTTSSFIVPTDASMNLANKDAPDGSTKNGNKTTSPFDVITTPAISEAVKSAKKEWDDKIKKGWDTKDIIPIIAKDASGKTTVVYIEVDPAETARRKKIDPNSETQYKIIHPPRTDTLISPNRGKSARNFLEEEFDIEPGELNKGDLTSPLGEFSTTVSELKDSVDELTILLEKDPEAKNPSTAKAIYGVNAILTKLSGVARSFDDYGGAFGNFTTLGKGSNTLYGIFATARITYNTANILGYVGQGLAALATGDVNGASEKFEKAKKYLETESLTIPIIQQGANAIAQRIVPKANAQKIREGGLRRGENAVLLREVETARTINQQLNLKTGVENIPQNVGKTEWRALTREQAISTKIALDEGRRVGSVGKVSGVLQAGTYVAYYGIPLAINLDQYYDDVEKEKKAKEIENDPSIRQKGIARQTNGTLIIDDDDVTAVDPYTNQAVTVKLPPCIPKPAGPPIIPYIQSQNTPTPSLSRFTGYRDNYVLLDPSADNFWSQVHITPEVQVEVDAFPESPSWWKTLAVGIYEGAASFVKWTRSLPTSIKQGMDLVTIRQFLEWASTNSIISKIPVAKSISPILTKSLLEPAEYLYQLIYNPTSVISKMFIYLQVFIEATQDVNSSEAEWIIKNDPIKFAEAQITFIQAAIDKLNDELYELDAVEASGPTGISLRQKIKELEDGKKSFQDALKNLKEKNYNYRKSIGNMSETARTPGGIKTKGKFEETTQNEEEQLSTTLPTDKDAQLASSACFCIEAEEAKIRYDSINEILGELDKIGELISSDSIPIPPHKWPISGSSFVVCKPTDTVSCEKKPPFSPESPRTPVPVPIIPTCFPEYVLVKTHNGFKKISEFSIGDNVISFDADGKFHIDLVTDTFIHYDVEIYRYELSNGSHIDITKEHPVFISNDVFIEIGKLNIGDSILDVTGNSIKIIDFKFLSKETVYNIEVEKNHTYIADGLRVHNKIQIKRPDPNWSLAYILTSPDPGENRPELEFRDAPPRDPSPPVTDKAPTSTGDRGGETPDSGPPVGGTIPEQNPFENSATGGGEERSIPKEIIFEGCFAFDSLVKTPNGNIAIGKIQPNEEIFAYDFDGNEILTRVKTKFSHKNQEFKVNEYILSNGNKLKATDNHSIITVKDGKRIFLRLKELNVGDSLISDKNELIQLVQINFIGILPVYHIIPEFGQLLSINYTLVDVMDIIL